MSSLRLKRLHPQAFLPKRGTSGSIGYDLYTPQDFFLLPGINLIPLGIALAIPNGHYGRITSRSSLAKLGIDVTAGVIDEDYRGEINVCLHNHKETLLLKRGERIAQLILEKASILPLEEVDCLEETERGQGGFGSTGK